MHLSCWVSLCIDWYPVQPNRFMLTGSCRFQEDSCVRRSPYFGGTSAASFTTSVLKRPPAHNTTSLTAARRIEWLYTNTYTEILHLGTSSSTKKKPEDLTIPYLLSSLVIEGSWLSALPFVPLLTPGRDPSFILFFCFILRFWNHIFTCVSLSPRAAAISIRRARVKYLLKWNSFSNSVSCLLVKFVRPIFGCPGGT